VCATEKARWSEREATGCDTHRYTHTHTWKAKAVSFAFAAAKEICSANCSNILALPRTQAHAAPLPLKPLSPPPPLNLHSISFLFAGGPNNNWGEGG